MAYDIGPKIGIDGEAEFRRSIQQVSQNIKTLGSEMSVVTAQYARNADSQEALSAKSAVLNKQIEAQKEKLSLQQEMLYKVAAEFGIADYRTEQWQQTVNKSQAQLYKLENALADTNKTLDDTSDALDEAGDSAITFGDVLKANVIGDAIVSGIKKLAGMIREMAGEFIESAASVKAQTAQFEQTFGDLGGDAAEAINRVADASGILSTRLQGAATQIYAFARSSGGDAKKSMDIMERALKVSADSAAYYDRSLEDVTESLQSFLKGNYSNDAALGLSATETTRNAAAMELFGQKFSELTEIQKQDTLLKMVEDSMELSGAMGQAQREADGWENVQGNLTEAWKQFQAVIGTPILNNLVPLLKEATTGIQNMTENTDWESFGEGVSKAFAGVTKLASGIISTVTSATQIPAVTTIFENLATVISTLTISMIAYKTASSISGVIDKLRTATEAQTIAQAALNAIMNANPFVLVTTLIAGVVTALVTLYKTNDEFRKKVNEAWTSVEETVSKVISTITSGLKSLPSMMQQIGKNAVSGLWNGIKGMLDWLKSRIKELATSILSTMKSALGIHSPSTVMRDEVGKYMAQGVGVGFVDEMSNVQRRINSSMAELTAGPVIAAPAAQTAAVNQAGTSGGSNLAAAVRDALNGAAVYMSGRKVGQLVTAQQWADERAMGGQLVPV